MARRKTHEEFVAEVKALVGDEYKFLDEYSGNKFKLRYFHRICGNIHSVAPNSFLRGTRCAYCYGNMQLSTDQFKQRVEVLVGDEYVVLGEYINSMTKVKLWHKECGSSFEQRPSDFLHKNQRCPHCYGNIRKSTEAFRKEVFELVGDDYSVLGEYINSKEHITVRHNECSYEYGVAPNHFLNGRRCPKCANKLEITTEVFRKRVRELGDGDYTVIGQYTGNGNKMIFKHNSCGHEYLATPNTFMSGYRCPKCAGNQRKTTLDFHMEVVKLGKGEYRLQSEYENSKNKVTITHLICGNRYRVSPNDFLCGSRCPKCNMSKGESAIENYLTSRYVYFIPQMRFEDCRDKNPLPFDFAIIDSENKTVALVEYDGEQHYIARDFFGGELALRDRQRKDAIKTKYCADNNIPLIRIPYWEYDNIDAILTEKLLPLLYNADKNNAS